MKYSTKDLDNMQALDIFKDAMEELRQVTNENDVVYRLRHCTAWIYETDNFYILRSYNTYIACIEKATGYASDVLRNVYGYTATSAQHVSKFFKDYYARIIFRYR